MRKIIHIDMDAYYAAIEIMVNPSLKGKCVIVGGSPNSRGVVSTCSYEARTFGVRSGMASSQAWRLCPQAIFVCPNFTLYKEVSTQIMDIFQRFTDLIEPMSLDEAYLDVTENKAGEQYATEIAKRIKQEILTETRLTCSAGVSYNKFLAKIGSELNKPDGLSVITPQKAQEILFQLPIEKFHGIGKVTAARMKKLGIDTGRELHELPMKEMIRHFGKTGLFYYYVVRGIDNREVITEYNPKSISCENTFDHDVGELDELLEQLQHVVNRVAHRMQRKQINGQSVILKLKYDNFEYITRNLPLPLLTNDPTQIYRAAEQLLIQNWDSKRKVRLLGVGLNKLDTEVDETADQLVIPFFTDEIL